MGGAGVRAQRRGTCVVWWEIESVPTLTRVSRGFGGGISVANVLLRCG